MNIDFNINDLSEMDRTTYKDYLAPKAGMSNVSLDKQRNEFFDRISEEHLWRVIKKMSDKIDELEAKIK